MQINKLEVGRRQVDVGIKMIFDGIDPVPTHTVLFAAGELLKDLCDARGVKSELDKRFGERIKPEYREKMHHWMRRNALFFKHAKQDPDETIELLSPEVNLGVAFACIQRFRALNNDLSPAMRTFLMWFAFTRPNILMERPAHLVPFIKLFEELSGPHQLFVGKALLLGSENRKEELTSAFRQIAQENPRVRDKIDSAFSEAIAHLPAFQEGCSWG